MENRKANIAPFHTGQKVVGSDKVHPNSRVKKGHPYTIKVCHSSINPANGLGPFWYVGVHELPGNDWTAPWLYSPIEECKMPLMTFSEIKESVEDEILIDN